jgi:hypothetical protein
VPVAGAAEQQSPLLRIDLEPGDVVLTTRSGALSALIRRAADVPVSHAAIMVTPYLGIEARDDGMRVADESGGVYLCTREQLVTEGVVSYVAVRRPPAINAAVLQSWAIERVLSEERFASVGLAMMPALKIMTAFADLLDRAGESTSVSRVTLGTQTRARSVRLAEAVADGVSRLICAELVYRALLNSGCELDLTNAFFASAMTSLPPSRSDDVSVWREDPALTLIELAATRKPSPGSALRSSDELSAAVFLAVSNLTRHWRSRHVSDFPGDRADLVTPGDLLRLPPLTTVAEFRRDRSGWTAVTKST